MKKNQKEKQVYISFLLMNFRKGLLRQTYLPFQYYYIQSFYNLLKIFKLFYSNNFKLDLILYFLLHLIGKMNAIYLIFDLMVLIHNFLILFLIVN